jgi:hypothetical protein
MKTLLTTAEIIKIIAPIILAGGYVWYGMNYTTERVQTIERRQEQMACDYYELKKSIAVIQKDIEYIKLGVDEMRRRP